MKKWIVRFASLYVFNVVVLLAIGFLLSPVRVGWAALWASVILTAATIWLKPVVAALFRRIARKTAARRTRFGQKMVEYAFVLLVAAVVWVVVVLFSSVSVRGFFWGWVLPPIALLIAWAIYDLVDDAIEARTGALYDRALGGRADASPIPPAAPASTPASTPTSTSRDRADGLTDEQRRMLDEL